VLPGQVTDGRVAEIPIIPVEVAEQAGGPVAKSGSPRALYAIGALALVLLGVIIYLLGRRDAGQVAAAGTPSVQPTGTSAAVLAPPSVSIPAAPTSVEPPQTVAAIPTAKRPAWAIATGIAGRGVVRVPTATVPTAPAPSESHAEPPAVAPPREPGFLTLDTYPWTRVSEGGRVLGTTPMVRISLAPGAHVLSLDNPAENVHQTTTVVIKSGETISRRLAF
jgi:hypothetical protein